MHICLFTTWWLPLKTTWCDPELFCPDCHVRLRAGRYFGWAKGISVGVHVRTCLVPSFPGIHSRSTRTLTRIKQKMSE